MPAPLLSAPASQAGADAIDCTECSATNAIPAGADLATLDCVCGERLAPWCADCARAFLPEADEVRCEECLESYKRDKASRLREEAYESWCDSRGDGMRSEREYAPASYYEGGAA